MADLDDAIDRARGGDESAFVALFRAFQPLLLRYLHGVAREASDDIASEVWLDVVRGLGRFRGDEAGFRGWLFTIAHRRVVDMRRARARRPETPFADLPDDSIVPGAAWEAHERASTEKAIALIAELPAEQAEVVLLRVVGGLDVAMIAGIVGRRPATVRVQSHRGLKRLAGLLSERDVGVTDSTESSM